MRPVFACVPYLIVAASLVSSPAAAQDLVAKTEARTPAEELKSFKLPPGFEIQLVAAEPDINKPMNIAFDARGRLWVTSTVEYPYPAKEGQTPRDKVIVLSDIGPDGRARKVQTFAVGLNIPLGVLPIENGALVFAINHIRRMLDTDGDGRADKSEMLLGSFGSKDTHGMTNHFTVGFDGWVYANHGFNNESNIRASDGSSIKLVSGNNYRFKLDGSRVETFALGQVNPFGLTFDPLGNLYSADCHTRPQYLLLRGAVYPSFGKPDDGLGFGPAMCFHDHGSTGIAGTLYYAADHFPEKYRGMLFNGNPVTNRINHDAIKWNGSSPLAVDQGDFLSSEDPWFRPVDLVLGPDGAMYVADFYNRIIGRYEVDLAHPGQVLQRGLHPRRLQQRRHARLRRRPVLVCRPRLPEVAQDLRGQPDRPARLLGQLPCVRPRRERRRVVRHLRHRLPRHRVGMVREPTGQGRALEAPPRVQAHRQRVPGARRPDRRRQTRTDLPRPRPARLGRARPG